MLPHLDKMYGICYLCVCGWFSWITSGICYLCVCVVDSLESPQTFVSCVCVCVCVVDSLELPQAFVTCVCVCVGLILLNYLRHLLPVCVWLILLNYLRHLLPVCVCVVDSLESPQTFVTCVCVCGWFSWITSGICYLCVCVCVWGWFSWITSGICYLCVWLILLNYLRHLLPVCVCVWLILLNYLKVMFCNDLQLFCHSQLQKIRMNDFKTGNSTPYSYLQRMKWWFKNFMRILGTPVPKMLSVHTTI